MEFQGSTSTARARSEADWMMWYNRAQKYRRSQVADFAVRLVATIETRVGSPRPHVADLAEQAMVDAGRSLLTDAQACEVVLLLHRVWKYGPALRNWASRQGLLR